MTFDDEKLPEETGKMAERYIESCYKEFWQKVFQEELRYLIVHLRGCRDILSVGCGPAMIEGELAKKGFRVTGLDVSREALKYAPDQVRTIMARLEDVALPESSFDAVIYVVSLQFIENYRKALEKTVSVLRANGQIIVLLLNTHSAFFKEKVKDPDSYIHKIRHADLSEIEQVMAESFYLRAEYFMGVKQGELFESQDPDWAVLYILTGTKKAEEVKGMEN